MLNKRSNSTQENRRWIGWFEPSSRPVRQGPLVLSEILVKRETSRHPTLVISVSRTSGKAHLRNRFRRMIRAHLEKEGLQNDLWLRLQKTHKLNQKIIWEDWKDLVMKALSQLPNKASSKPSSNFIK